MYRTAPLIQLGLLMKAFPLPIMYFSGPTPPFVFISVFRNSYISSSNLKCFIVYIVYIPPQVVALVQLYEISDLKLSLCIFYICSNSDNEDSFKLDARNHGGLPQRIFEKNV